MTYSVTEREVYLRCRRLWDYSSLNRQRLTPFVTKKALSLGSLIHTSFATWLLNPTADPIALFKDSAISEVDKIKEIYSKQIGVEMSDMELAPLYEAVGLGIKMVENYADYWGSPLPKGFNLLAPEQEVIVPVTDTLSLEGTLDGIIERNGVLYVLERKTYSYTPRKEVLQQNDQFLAYIWILHQMNAGAVGGLVYDGLWKRPEPPRGKTRDDLFMRHLIIRPPEELEEFSKHVVMQLSEMANNPNIYPNRRWEGCQIDCSYEKLCTAQSRNEDTDYIKRNSFVVKEKK